MIISLGLCCARSDSETAVEPGFDPSKSDARAIEIVNEMWQALGGRENWENARDLSFCWIVERDGKDAVDYRHDWDRHTNRYRLEGTNRQGQHFVALFNTDSKQGEVYLNEEKMLPDSSKIKMLTSAYGRYINDVYWLIMPFKLNDPGVLLSYDGEKEVDGRTYDVVKVTFEGVGLTPGDTYWAYIDKEERLMHKWEYVLQGWEPDREPTASWWRDWQDFGGIKLAMNKDFEGQPLRIYFKDVKVASRVDEEIFTLTSKTF
ncbi:hypothetical protein MJD09_02040 [bacterium]|nr:hypothetical protein [bacterium]